MGATSTIAAPERSYDQRMEALTRANEIRSTRAELKQQVKRREQDALELLGRPIAELDTMKVFDLLLAIPKVGRVKVNKMLAAARVSPSKTVGGLSERQRRELMAIVRAFTPGGPVRA